MRRASGAGALVLGVVAAIGLSAQARAGAPALRTSTGRLPLYFEENRGQYDRRIDFVARSDSRTILIGAQEAVVLLGKRARSKDPILPLGLNAAAAQFEKSAAVRMKWASGSGRGRARGIGRLPGVVHHLRGRDRRSWYSNVPLYESVTCPGVLPGAEVKFHGTEQQVEFDIVTRPDAVPSLELTYEGAERVTLDPAGTIRVETQAGTMFQRQPVAYQIVQGRRRDVACKYRARAPGKFGLELGPTDRTVDVCIDPVLLFSTFLGSTGVDAPPSSLALDAEGAIYLTGTSFGTDYPTQMGVQVALRGNCDAVVTKLSPNGDALVYSTYLGGTGEDRAYGIALDPLKNAYVVGTTYSTDLPTRNAYQSAGGGSQADAFVAKLSADGASLLYSTYFGGSSTDQGFGIAVHAVDQVTFVGVAGPGFPAINSQQTQVRGSTDAYVARLSTAGAGVAFCLLIGGNGYDQNHVVVVDPAGTAYVGGITVSTDFVTVNPLPLPSAGNAQGYEAVFSKISSAGAIQSLSMFGGTYADNCSDVARDASGNLVLYVASDTIRSITNNVVGSSPEGMAVLRLNADATAVSAAIGVAGTYATQLGLDTYGRMIAAGWTTSLSSGFPLVNPLYQRTDSDEGTVTVFSADARSIEFSTYIGGNGSDRIVDIGLDSANNIVLLGHTASQNFPTKNALQQALGGPSDYWVAKLSAIQPAPVGPVLAVSSVQPALAGLDVEVTFTVTSNESLSPDPALTVGGKSAELIDTSGLTYTFRRKLDGSEGQPAPQLAVTGTNAAGVTTVLRTGGLTTDFTPPAFSSTSITPSKGKAGTLVSVGFTLSESVPSDPFVTIGGKDAARKSLSSLSYVFERTLAGDEATGDAPVVVSATDAARNTTSATIGTIFLDFTPPGFFNVDATPPVAKLGTPVTLVFSATEALPTTPAVTVGPKAATYVSRQDTAYTYSLTVDSEVPEGLPPVLIRGEDVVGNAGELTVYPLRTDYTAPQIQDASVSPAIAREGTDVRAVFSVDEGLATTPVVTIGGQSMRLFEREDNRYEFRRLLDKTESEGDTTVAIQVRDVAGNERSTTLGIRTDFTPPSATAIAIAPTLLSAGRTLCVTFTASESMTTTPTVTVGASEMALFAQADRTFTFKRSIDTNEGAGDKPLSVRLEDDAGHVVNQPLGSVTFDFEKPTFSDVTANPSAATRNVTVTISFIASEALDGTPTVTVGGQSTEFVTRVDRTYTFRRVISGNEGNGAAPVVITGVDPAGNENAETFTPLKLDLRGPQATSLVVSPTRATTNTAVQVSFTADKDVDGTPSVKLGTRQMTLQSVTGRNYVFGLTIDGTEGSGTTKITIDMSDGAGNPTHDESGSVELDFVGPTFTNLVASPPRAGRNATVNITFTSDEALQSDPVATVGRQSATKVFSAGLTYLYRVQITADVGADPPVVKIVGRDSLGQEGITTATPLRVDLDAPFFDQVAVSPSRAGLQRTVRIAFHASEPIPNGPVVSVGGVPATRLTSAGEDYTFSVETSAAMIEGSPELLIRGFDAFGNLGTGTSTPLITDFSVPQPIISGYPTPVKEGSTRDFLGGASVARSGISSFAWAFGDGDVSTEKNVKHVYVDGPKTMLVTLVATNGVGVAGSAELELPVLNVSPTITMDPVSGPMRRTNALNWQIDDPGTRDTHNVTLIANDLVTGITTEILRQATASRIGSFDLDSALLPDSIYQLKIFVADNDGGQGTDSSEPFVVDNENLTITPGAADPQTFNPRFAEKVLLVYDLSEHASTKVELTHTTQQTQQTVIGTLQPLSDRTRGHNGVEWNGKDPTAVDDPNDPSDAFLPDGQYGFRVTGIDKLANTVVADSAQKGFTITYHSGPPSPPTISPTPPRRTATTPITVSGRKEPHTGIILSRNGQEILTSAVDLLSTWTVRADLLDATNTLSVIAYDSAAQRSTPTVTTITLDQTGPAPVVVTAYQPNATAPNQEISGTKDPNTGVLLNGSKAVELSAATTWSLPVRYDAGTTSFTFIAEDDVGNRSAATTIQIHLESNSVAAPTIGAFTSPTASKDLTLTGTKQANANIRVEVSGIDDTSFRKVVGAPWSQSTSWRLTLPLAEGRNRLVAQSFDSIWSPSGIAEAVVVRDTVSPALQISGVSDGEVRESPSLQIAASYSDPAPASGIATESVRLFLDGQDSSNAAAVSGGGASITFDGLSAGSHLLSVQVRDRAGNQAGTVVSFYQWADDGTSRPTLQPTDKDIHVFSPDNVFSTGDGEAITAHYTVSEPATVTAEVIDAGGAHVRTIAPRGVGIPGKNCSMTWDGRFESGDLVTPGQYEIQLRPTNVAGRQGATVRVKAEVYY